MNTFLHKNTISAVVTDSGLGGLSICADLVNNLKQRRDFQKVAITYFDARPEQVRGYNLLPTMAEKIRVFDCALTGMERFRPDIILIACNTLSVLYARTPYSRNTSTPVVDIIDFGVQMINERLAAQPDSQVIIFGTPTTIEANTHTARLIERGIAADRIIAQSCDRLAGEIEEDPGSNAVRAMVDRCAGQAAARLKDKRKPLVAALCCTHYGYSRTLFQQTLERYVTGAVTILNPNSAMSACIAGDGRPGVYPAIQVSVSVVSKIIISGAAVGAISNALAAVSPVAAEALQHYRYDPALFSF